MTPVEFETHAGRASNKKWRQSIWVQVPAVTPDGSPTETTVEQCQELKWGKRLVSVPLNPGEHDPVKISSQAPRRKPPSTVTRVRNQNLWKLLVDVFGTQSFWAELSSTWPLADGLVLSCSSSTWGLEVK
jgi:hypothetical protein